SSKLKYHLKSLNEIQKIISNLLDINMYKKINKLRIKHNIPMNLILELLENVGISISQQTLYRRFKHYKPKWQIDKKDKPIIKI
ncbi:hypothetical protein JIY74_38400, partial [Vibrio harveyi]|nr:hypothetical protein [Vibrio harveyi]